MILLYVMLNVFFILLFSMGLGNLFMCIVIVFKLTSLNLFVYSRIVAFSRVFIVFMIGFIVFRMFVKFICG